MPDRAPASITSVRGRLRDLFDAGELAARRDLIVLAVDGIPFDLATAVWEHAELERLQSVFPTTSSTAWLSSLTGLDVQEHGIPGVAFAEGEGDLVNIYTYQGALGEIAGGNIFTDARSAGYRPLAILGDLATLDCTWRSQLLDGASLHGRSQFFAGAGHGPGDVPQLVRAEIESARSEEICTPRFIWCFIDADLYIHRQGYDEPLVACLTDLEELACELAQDGAVVVAYSDHGLIRTTTCPALTSLLDEAQEHCDRPMGGAGRTRWLYPADGKSDLLATLLTERAPPDVRVARSSLFFPPGSLASSRAGPVVLIAEGERFLVPDGYLYDHGSLTDQELSVPFAVWK
jgi:hypothetical protein